MIADLFVSSSATSSCSTVPAGVKDDVLARLDQFVFSEDVQLGDVTGTFARVRRRRARRGADGVPVRRWTSDAGRLEALAAHGNLAAPRTAGEPGGDRRVRVAATAASTASTCSSSGT